MITNWFFVVVVVSSCRFSHRTQFSVHSQCEEKEEYIERIQTLDFDTKAAIASHIQEVRSSRDGNLDIPNLRN